MRVTQILDNLQLRLIIILFLIACSSAALSDERKPLINSSDDAFIDLSYAYYTFSEYNSFASFPGYDVLFPRFSAGKLAELGYYPNPNTNDNEVVYQVMLDLFSEVVSNYKISPFPSKLVIVQVRDNTGPLALAVTGLQKIQTRDFGSSDLSEAISFSKGPSNQSPPMPLREIFRNAAVWQGTVAKGGKASFEFDPRKTQEFRRYVGKHFFANHVLAQNVEDAYSEYQEFKRKIKYQQKLAEARQLARNQKREQRKARQCASVVDDVGLYRYCRDNTCMGFAEDPPLYNLCKNNTPISDDPLLYIYLTRGINGFTGKFFAPAKEYIDSFEKRKKFVIFYRRGYLMRPTVQ